MTIEALKKARPTGKQAGVISRHYPNGETDPIFIVEHASLPDESKKQKALGLIRKFFRRDNAIEEPFIAHNADPFRTQEPLFALGVVATRDGEAKLEIVALDVAHDVAGDSNLVYGLGQIVLDETGVDHAVVETEGLPEHVVHKVFPNNSSGNPEAELIAA